MFQRQREAGCTRIILTISVPPESRSMLELGERIRRVEGRDRPDLFLRALVMFVNKKQMEINPQLQLDGKHVTLDMSSEAIERKVEEGIRQLRRRGYTYRDIATVTEHSKTQVVRICSGDRSIRIRRLSPDNSESRNDNT